MTSLRRPSVDLPNQHFEIQGKQFALLKEPHHTPVIPLTASHEVAAILRGPQVVEDSVSGAEPRGLHLDTRGNPQLIDTTGGKLIVAGAEGFSNYFTRFVDWARSAWATNGPIWQEKLGRATVAAAEGFSRGLTRSVDYSREKLAETGEKISEKTAEFQARRRSRGEHEHHEHHKTRLDLLQTHSGFTSTLKRAATKAYDSASTAYTHSKEHARRSFEGLKEDVREFREERRLSRSATLPAAVAMTHATSEADKPIVMQADPTEVADSKVRPVDTSDLRTANSGAAEVIINSADAKPLTATTREFIAPQKSFGNYLGKSDAKVQSFGSLHKSMNPNATVEKTADKEIIFNEERRVENY